MHATSQLQNSFSFGGPDVTSADAARLGRQLQAVRELMADGQWRTLEGIQAALAGQGIEAMLPGISARLRDLRKARFGGLTVDRERVEGGLFRYRVR